ncbi:MAG TPA: hypothetical protein VFQ84_12460 [Arenimonas sp.]|nr:hypothetical protein [Arenimonas sp.]
MQVASAVAGPRVAHAGNAVENAMGAKAASVLGDVAGSAVGEGAAACLIVAGSFAVDSAARVEAAVGQAASQLSDAMQKEKQRMIDEINPNTGK